MMRQQFLDFQDEKEKVMLFNTQINNAKRLLTQRYVR